MTRRRKSLFVLAAALPLLAFVVGYVVWPTSPISRANLGKIEEGMTRAEVEKLLGGTEGDYRKDKFRAFDSSAGKLIGEHRLKHIGKTLTVQRWTCDTLQIEVLFDEKDTVVQARGLYPIRSAWYRELEMWLPWLD